MAVRFDATFLDRAQEGDLHARRHLPDLVEEERASAGELEAPFPRAHRARERARFVAEELALQQALREGAAVDGDERSVRARARGVDRVGDQLLSRACFAEQQDRRVCLRCSPHQLRDRPQSAAPADHGLVARRPLRLRERVEELCALGDLTPPRCPPEATLDGLSKLHRFPRLHDLLVSMATPQGVEDARGVAVRGDDHAHHLRVAL